MGDRPVSGIQFAYLPIGGAWRMYTDEKPGPEARASGFANITGAR